MFGFQVRPPVFISLPSNLAFLTWTVQCAFRLGGVGMGGLQTFILSTSSLAIVDRWWSFGAASGPCEASGARSLRGEEPGRCGAGRSPQRGLSEPLPHDHQTAHRGAGRARPALLQQARHARPLHHLHHPQPHPSGAAAGERGAHAGGHSGERMHQPRLLENGASALSHSRLCRPL